MAAHILQRDSGQTGAAAKVQHAVKRAEVSGLDPLTRGHWDGISKLIDQNAVKHLRMLIKQHRDIRLRRLGWGLTATHGGQANRDAARISGIERQRLVIGDLGLIQPARLFMGEPGIIGVGQRIIGHMRSIPSRCAAGKAASISAVVLPRIG